MKSLRVLLSLGLVFGFSFGLSNPIANAEENMSNNESNSSVAPGEGYVDNGSIPYADPNPYFDDGNEDGENNVEEVTVVTPESSEVINSTGAGEWDYIGSDLFQPTSDNFYSSDGDVRFDLKPFRYGTYYYDIYEYDETNADDYVDTLEVAYSGGIVPNVVTGISSFCDGDNGKAEFYVKANGVEAEMYDTYVEVYD